MSTQHPIPAPGPSLPGPAAPTAAADAVRPAPLGCRLAATAATGQLPCQAKVCPGNCRHRQALP